MSNSQAVKDVLAVAIKPPETLEQAIQRLAQLSRLGYEQIREAEAKTLNLRVSVLDREIARHRAASVSTKEDSGLFPVTEVWSAPVDGDQLLNDICSLIRYYIICNTETAIAATLWVSFTWLIDQAKVAPIAMITAPEKRCGKSQLLDLIGRLSRRPLVASNISPAAIFRVIEAHQPTLLIDEADAFLRDNEEARGILNSGHTRQSAYVIRVVGDDHEAQQFSTWGAKAICGIGKQADTLMDRSVILELRRKMPDETVQRLRHADPLQFDIFRQQLARFALDAADTIAEARPTLPEALNDRAQDNWEPLLAIADYAGGDWPRLAREAAVKISGKEGPSVSLSTELLQDIKTVLEDKRLLKVKTMDLIDYLCEDDMRPWATYYRGNRITPRQLANRLGEYGIEPKSIRLNGATPKGYEADQFTDAFARYIPSPPPPPESATPQHNPGNSEP